MKKKVMGAVAVLCALSVLGVTGMTACNKNGYNKSNNLKASIEVTKEQWDEAFKKLQEPENVTIEFIWNEDGTDGDTGNFVEINCKTNCKIFEGGLFSEYDGKSVSHGEIEEVYIGTGITCIIEEDAAVYVYYDDKSTNKDVIYWQDSDIYLEDSLKTAVNNEIYNLTYGMFADPYDNDDNYIFDYSEFTYSDGQYVRKFSYTRYDGEFQEDYITEYDCVVKILESGDIGYVSIKNDSATITGKHHSTDSFEYSFSNFGTTSFSVPADIKSTIENYK